MDAIDRPLTLRSGLTLDQRIAMAPLTNTQSHLDGSLSDEEFTWLERRARGGFRFISTCATYISDEGKAWEGQLGIANAAHEEAIARIPPAMHAHGAKAIVQLHHGGAVAKLSPRKLSTFDDPEAGIHGATQADLDRVVQDFVAATLRAQRAGFDGVELHGANGYLFTQFLAPDTNPRRDAYGGPLEARARLLLETLRAVRAAVGRSFTVGVRISPCDTWARRGLLLADSVRVGQWLAEEGTDFVHLSLGNASGPPPFEDGDTPVVTAFRQALPAEVPVFAAGGMFTRDEVGATLDAGADVAVLGRASIRYPEWVHDSRQPDFSPERHGWTAETMTHLDVSPRFVDYLRSLRGMVRTDGLR